MATYYVRTDGNNANTGTGSATNQAWQTIAYAFANMTLTTGVNTLYIAPGVYRESPTLTVTPTSSNTLVISGDPSASQFSGITAGQIRITGATSDSARSSGGTRVSLGSKTYTTIQNVVIESVTDSLTFGLDIRGANVTVDKCVFSCIHLGATIGSAINIQPASATGNAIYIKNTFIYGSKVGVYVNLPSSSTGTSGVEITNNRFVLQPGGSYGIFSYAQSGSNIASILFSNNVILSADTGLHFANGNTTDKHIVQNNILAYCTTGIYSVTNLQVTQRNNIINCVTQLTNVASDATTITSDFLGIDLGQNLLQGFGSLAPFGTLQNSRNTAFGTATSAPATDAYGVAWTGATPDAGAVTYRNIASVSPYVPTERNASVVTIAPGSTSQSIELYLGATGLTASTTGLTARYNRTRTASVSIPLVARTIAQAWTAGGFAEVDATNMPGVYRLDLPDAALAAGADDVTVVVRGASGTNGAVMMVKLSSGGLTAAQTAAAVWDASRSAYATAGTFGEYVNVNVNSGAIADAVWDEARSGHTTVGTFGQYVNAELVTPVTSAALVRMGPFEVRADGLGASDPLDIQTGAQHGIDIQCVDNNGSGIDITSATVTAKVYNSGATLVDTYACTATYAADGRATFTIDTTVTNTPGTYTATITRTTGASDTQVFGPLRIYVRDI
jgi:hypothetical protein